MFRFRIDPPALAAAATQVSKHLGEIEAAQAQLARARGAASSFGAGDVAAAFSAAVMQWEEELRHYGESLSGLAENLADAARDYSETERVVM